MGQESRSVVADEDRASGAPLRGGQTPASAVIRVKAAQVDPLLAGNALTILVPIVPDRRAQLASLLSRIGTNIDTSSEMRFSALTTVHFMRWVVIDGAKPGDTAQLAFESNYDGTLQQHLVDLFTHGARCMHEIYRCCEGYPFAGLSGLVPAQYEQAIGYLEGQEVPYAAFYVGRRGKSASRICAESKLREAIEAFLDGFGADPMRSFGSAEAVYDAIVRHLGETHAAELAALARPAPAPPRRTWLPVLGRGLLALPALPLAALLYPLLRAKEASDVEESFDVLPAQTRELMEREDFQVQNQLTHLVPVKPGLVRALVLRAVFLAIDTLARFYYNQGDLGGLATIHYARWVLIDGGKRLLFFSNYDGSWERYLGDFIDQAHVGLTAVWSNTQGFPRTKNLIFDGAEDEERFKAWTRTYQIPTQLWYSAYKHLTVPNVANNGAICAGLLRKPATAQELERWLALL
jgi:hypothetical protein